MCIDGSSLVLESDGTIIDDDEVLKVLHYETLMLLQKMKYGQLEGVFQAQSLLVHQM